MDMEQIAAKRLRYAAEAMRLAVVALKWVDESHALEMQRAATTAIEWADELDAIHSGKQTPNLEVTGRASEAGEGPLPQG